MSNSFKDYCHFILFQKICTLCMELDETMNEEGAVRDIKLVST